MALYPLAPALLAQALADVICDTEAHGNAPAAFHEESHYQAGIWSWLRHHGASGFPVAEGCYSDERWRERCDICILDSKKPIAWIELKKAYLGVGDGWQPKPAEQLRSLMWDVAKVVGQTACSGGDGYVAVFFYNQRTVPFLKEVGVAESLIEQGECVTALMRWYSALGARSAYSAVRRAFGLPTRTSADQIQALYLRSLSVIADVKVVAPQVQPSELDYVVVAGRLKDGPDLAS